MDASNQPHLLFIDLTADFAVGTEAGVDVDVAEPVDDVADIVDGLCAAGVQGHSPDEAAGRAEGTAIEGREVHADACVGEERCRRMDVREGAGLRKVAIRYIERKPIADKEQRALAAGGGGNGRGFGVASKRCPEEDR